MKKPENLILPAAMMIGLLASSAPAFAHHSFAAEFDAKKPVTLTGTVGQAGVDESACALLHQREGPGRRGDGLGI